MRLGLIGYPIRLMAVKADQRRIKLREWPQIYTNSK